VARSRNLPRWTFALWAVCLLATTTAHLGGPHEAATAGAPPAAVGMVSQAPGAAVLPARTSDEVRSTGQAAPLRVLVLAMVLALLLGLPAVRRRRLPAGGHGAQPLRARRHTIALRAPPLQLA